MAGRPGTGRRSSENAPFQRCRARGRRGPLGGNRRRRHLTTTSTRSRTSLPTARGPRKRPTRRSSTAGGSSRGRRHRGGRRTTARTPRRSTTAAVRSRRSPSRSQGRRPAPSSTASPTDFVVTQNGKTGAARFLFATEGGHDPRLVADRERRRPRFGASTTRRAGAVYKGLTTAADRLYATDFHNGRVDVFDATFTPVTLAAVHRPEAAEGLRAVRHPGARGQHLRHVREAGRREARRRRRATASGTSTSTRPTAQLVARVASGGRKNAPPNAPWGLALAPTSFGVFSGDILVGNFGNGRVSAYQDRGGGKWVFKGQLRHGDGTIVDDRRPLGDRVRQRRRRRPGDDALLHGRSRRRGSTVCSDRSLRRSSDSMR